MEQKDKELLVRYLSMALPYGVKLQYQDKDYDFFGIDRGRIFVNIARPGEWLSHTNTYEVKPYLRPMSSMSYDDVSFLCHLQKISGFLSRYNAEHFDTKGYVSLMLEYTDMEGITQTMQRILTRESLTIESLDWLNQCHFDYRGLIEKGLALKANKKMYIDSMDEAITKTLTEKIHQTTKE